MKKKWFANIFLLITIFCGCSKSKSTPEPPASKNAMLHVNESLVSVMSKEDSLLVKSVESYVIQCNHSNYDPSDAWFYVDSLSVYPYFELFKNVNESNLIQVLGLSFKGRYKVIKLAVLKGINIEAILNVPAIPSKQMGYILLNYYDTYQRVSSQQFNTIRYFNHSKDSIALEEVKKMQDFSRQLSTFFKIPELKFDYYLFDNSKELFAALGYEYSPDMYSRYQSNSFCRPADLSIFSGNSSAYHPHELTHLYVHTYTGDGNPNAGNPNKLMDEGFATYFGGSQGFTLEQSTQMAQSYLQAHQVCFDTMDQLGFLIDNVVNFRNVFLGNFVRHLIEVYSPDYALQVLSEYKTEDEVDLLINSFRLPDETFNEFVIRMTLSNNLSKCDFEKE